MVVIMPLTSAGIFATDLHDGKWPAVAGFLAIGLTYAATLAVARALTRRKSGEATGGASRATTSRRSVAILFGGAAVAWGATYLGNSLTPRSRTGTRIAVLDPQEPVPSGGIDPPGPYPNLLPPSASSPDSAMETATGPQTQEGLPSADAPPVTGGSGRQPGPAAEAELRVVATASSGEQAEPPEARTIGRDKDGAVLPSGRRSGELAELITTNTATLPAC
jgi:hypothetical protein